MANIINKDDSMEQESGLNRINNIIAWLKMKLLSTCIVVLTLVV